MLSEIDMALTLDDVRGTFDSRLIASQGWPPSTAFN